MIFIHGQIWQSYLMNDVESSVTEAYLRKETVVDCS